MKTFTKEEVADIVGETIGDIERDNYGQLVIYTGIFEWKDGSFHDESEPNPALDGD